MLNELRENPAYFVHSSLLDAIDDIDEISSFGSETMTVNEILSQIAKAESNIAAAVRFLDMAKAKYQHRKKPADNRIIYRDVACRYMRIYGGKTEWIQTHIDDGYPVLIDADGDERGKVSSFAGYHLAQKIAAAEKMVSTIPF